MPWKGHFLELTSELWSNLPEKINIFRQKKILYIKDISVVAGLVCKVKRRGLQNKSSGLCCKSCGGQKFEIEKIDTVYFA